MVGWLASRVFLLIEKSSRFLPSLIFFIVWWMKIWSLIFWWKPVCLPGHWTMKLGHFKKLRWWSRLLPLCKSLTVFSRSRNWSVLIYTKLRWYSQIYYHHHPLPQPKLDGRWRWCILKSLCVCPCVCVCVWALSRRYHLNRSTSCHQTWYGGAYHERECHGIKCGCTLQGQGHSEDSYNQNMTVSIITSELMILLQPKLSLMVDHHKPTCPMKRLDWCVQVKVNAEVHNSNCLSGWYLLNHWWWCGHLLNCCWCITMSQSVMRKDCFAI